MIERRDVSIPPRTEELHPKMPYFFRRRQRPGCWQKDFERAWRRSKAERRPLDAEALEAVRNDVLSHIEAWVTKDPEQGRLGCRNELMNSMERICLRRALDSLDPQTRTQVAERLPEFRQFDHSQARQLKAEKFRTELLRTWTGLFYGDRARGDWYDVYAKAAEMRMNSIERDFERIAGLPVHTAENNRDAAIRGLNAAIRLRLLQMPPGRAVTHRSLRTRLRQLLHHEDEVYEQDG